MKLNETKIAGSYENNNGIGLFYRNRLESNKNESELEVSDEMVD